MLQVTTLQLQRCRGRLLTAILTKETASSIRITEWLISTGYPGVFTGSDILKTYRAET